uniref:C2 domain-containing protein 5 n=1 Tax=Oncorhynchus kisutch TaxID=8019 RepID=A0A8C7HAN4_ONCKI
MPGKLKAKIVAGRHLPVMDRASDLTDAFVEVKFGNTTFKTDVYPKSLNPQWNSEWFKFEVDDEDLQDEPLQITVLDHDTYSANDAIGKVYIDIDPLLSSEAATVISGWFPIYDTIHGIRGEINVLVKVDLFNDLNRFRQSSCGVKFFCTTSIPRCYRAALVHGFVEELVVNEDPEYQWIDRIRTPRASNEARQRLISLMSGELQRKIGLKVLEMGGNAVVGYLQCFDLEGESGLVVRAIGTACTLDKLIPGTGSNTITHTNTAPASNALLNECMCVCVCCCSLILSGMGSGISVGKEAGPLKTLLRQQAQSALEQREFPFFTLTCFPPGFLVHIGGVVSARSVKLLDRIHNPDEPETRDAWWEEIRQEIKSHAKALGCHAVVGYSESTTICEEVCILSASGTAAMLNPRFMREGCLDAGGSDQRLSRQPPLGMVGSERAEGEVSSSWLGFDDASPPSCGFCHIPYDEFNMPFPAQLTYCYHCRRQKVPDVLFTTIDLPAEAAVTGKGCLIQARLCRTKKVAQGGVCECIEEVVGSPIPDRQRSRLFRSTSESSDELSELDLSHGKKDAFVLEIDDTDAVEDIQSLLTDAPMPAGFYSCNTEVMPGIYNWTSGLQMFTSVRVYRLNNANLTNQGLNKIFTDLCENLLKSLYFKLRSMIPCCLCHLNFTVAVPEEELIQVRRHTPKNTSPILSIFPRNILLVHMCVYVSPVSSVDYGSFADRCSTWLELLRLKAHTIRRGSVKTISSSERCSPLPEVRSRSLRSTRSLPCGAPVTVVKMTPLSFLPMTRIVKYLGIINMFFIRETTSLREEGGVSGFLHSFIAEVFAMVRAHVAALGGNAVVSYSMKECVFMENPNKNQAQCLINVSGDAVIFVRESDQEAIPPLITSGQTSTTGADGTT